MPTNPKLKKSTHPSNPFPGKAASHPWLKKLAAGVVLAVVTAFVGHIVWMAHQESSRKHEQLTELRSLQVDIARQVGGLVTAAMLLIQAHEKSFEIDAWNELLKEHNQLQSDWDRNVDALQVRVQRDLLVPDGKGTWDLLLGELGDLDDQITELEKFDTKDKTAAHRSQIAKSHQQVTNVEDARRKLDNCFADSTRHLQ